MTANNSLAMVPSHSLIPAHVLERDAIAQAAGLAVARYISDGELFIDWLGTEAQLRSTELFSAKFKFQIGTKRRNVHHRYIHWGMLAIEDSSRITLTWRENLPAAIAAHDVDPDIQVLQFAEDAGAFCKGKTGYYGEQATLVRAGIIVEKQAPSLTRCKDGRINSRSSPYRADNRWLDIYRLPNGKLLVYEERTEDRAKQREEEESETLERLPAIIRALPPFVPGSMSEAEKLHMRILRGLSDRRYEAVMEFASRLLCLEDVKGTTERQGLRLVVDNDATP